MVLRALKNALDWAGTAAFGVLVACLLMPALVRQLVGLGRVAIVLVFGVVLLAGVWRRP